MLRDVAGGLQEQMQVGKAWPQDPATVIPCKTAVERDAMQKRKTHFRKASLTSKCAFFLL